MQLIWRKFNHTRDIPIDIDDNVPDKILAELITRLVGGTFECVGTQPRGRRYIYFMEDACILEYPPNPECTGMAGIKICGDAVIVDPDTRVRINRA